MIAKLINYHKQFFLGMTSSENDGSSNPFITPISSHQSPMTVVEDNTNPCSTPLDRLEDAQAQPNNEITEERGRLKLVVWNHFKKRKDKVECNYCMRLLVGGGGLKMVLNICMTTLKYVLGKFLRTLGI